METVSSVLKLSTTTIRSAQDSRVRVRLMLAASLKVRIIGVILSSITAAEWTPDYRPCLPARNIASPSQRLRGPMKILGPSKIGRACPFLAALPGAQTFLLPVPPQAL